LARPRAARQTDNGRASKEPVVKHPLYIRGKGRPRTGVALAMGEVNAGVPIGIARELF
jgi:hypothetical protein